MMFLGSRFGSFPFFQNFRNSIHEQLALNLNALFRVYVLCGKEFYLRTRIRTSELWNFVAFVLNVLDCQSMNIAVLDREENDDPKACARLDYKRPW